jgi:hypothetical protein
MKLFLLSSLLAAAVAAFTVAPAQAAEGPVRHVVSFKFKSDADPAKVKAVEEAFAALKQKIPLIQQLEWGTNSSPEKHDKGFTHIWVVTFKDGADRDAYLVHPEHKAFAGHLKGIIDDVLVIDFIPKE